MRAFACWNTAIHDWHVVSGEYGILICRNAEETELAASVRITGAEIPAPPYDADTIIMDLDEKARQILQERMRRFMSAFESEQPEEDSAISAEMSLAMMEYMPLRTFVSFSGMTLEELDRLISLINQT